MNKTIKHSTRGMAAVIYVMAVVSLLFSIIACSGNNQETVTVVFDPENTYTMKSVDVSTLISDSGITRYRANAALFLMYEKANSPYWYFPEGIYIEKFDTLFNMKANIKADTAWFYQKDELWKGIGNVEIRTLEGDYISSSIIYWDKRLHRIYSDQFTLIEKEGKTIRSQNGFESDESLSYYHLFNSSANLPFDESSQDSTYIE